MDTRYLVIVWEGDTYEHFCLYDRYAIFRSKQAADAYAKEQTNEEEDRYATVKVIVYNK